MAIPEAHVTNFRELIRVFALEHVGLVECVLKKTGEKVYVICAGNPCEGDNNDTELVPFAMMFNSDPYELLIPPSPDDPKSIYRAYIELQGKASIYRDRENGHLITTEN